MSEQAVTPRSDLLVWIDLEMTGLEPNKERIIEVATLITDAHLNVVAEGPVIAVKQPDSLLAAMDDLETFAAQIALERRRVRALFGQHHLPERACSSRERSELDETDRNDPRVIRVDRIESAFERRNCEQHLALRGGGLAHHRGAADLRVIALHAGRELGGDKVARLDLVVAGRVHAAHVHAAGTQDLEVLGAAIGTIVGLDTGHQLVFGLADFYALQKYLVAVIGQLRGAAVGAVGLHGGGAARIAEFDGERGHLRLRQRANYSIIRRQTRPRDAIGDHIGVAEDRRVALKRRLRR